jgi:hypothetical protein
LLLRCRPAPQRAPNRGEQRSWCGEAEQ